MVFIKICPVDFNFAIFFQQYEQFKDEVRLELLGKTAQFWMSYIDDIAVFFLFYQSCPQFCKLNYQSKCPIPNQRVFIDDFITFG